jgi:hypothetical protein
MPEEGKSPSSGEYKFLLHIIVITKNRPGLPRGTSNEIFPQG